jgi:predicted RNase H-like HicB family nuclease
LDLNILAGVSMLVGIALAAYANGIEQVATVLAQMSTNRYNAEAKNKFDLSFVVEEEEGGRLSAVCASEGIFTQGRDKKDLENNIRDAVKLHFAELPEYEINVNLQFVTERESLLVIA